jgi:tRNA-splicing ligase RtcB
MFNMKFYQFNLKQIDDACWQLEKDYQGVPVIVFAQEKLLTQMDEEVFIQAKNVAQLPGLFQAVYIMPDAHSGYGAPIGTVFAMDGKYGFVAPGAVGFDINCGMRLITTTLYLKEVKPYIEKLVNKLFDAVPVGIGRKGFLKIKKDQLKRLVENGVPELLKMGYARNTDVANIEENGQIKNADFASLSKQAIERGIHQLATLGSGNHYLEIQKVEKIFDKKIAASMGIFEENQITVMVHCGSRGLGHQVCSDYLRLFEKNLDRFKIKVNDRQLACVPIDSELAKKYLGAMAAAANFAFVNRQLITYQIRQVFEKIFDQPEEKLGLNLVYDVAHNIAKFETFNGKKLLIHRKGATRSYPNQPVIIGGSMETGSYLLLGTKKALEKSFGSTAHGSGRTMSRAKAKKIIHGEKLQKELKNKGIYVKSASFAGLAEEAGIAYKNITDVVESITKTGLSQPIAYFKPIGNIKG